MTGAADFKKKRKEKSFLTHMDTAPEGPWDFKEPSTVPQRHLNTRCRRDGEKNERGWRAGDREMESSKGEREKGEIYT